MIEKSDSAVGMYFASHTHTQVRANIHHTYKQRSLTGENGGNECRIYVMLLIFLKRGNPFKVKIKSLRFFDNIHSLLATVVTCNEMHSPKGDLLMFVFG